MFKNKRNRYLLIFIVAIIVVILMIYSLIPNSIVNKTSSPFSALLRPIENLIDTVSEKSKNYFLTIKSNNDLMKENKELTEQNVELRLQVKENEAAAIEFDKIKNIYNLSNKYDYVNFVGARILQKPLNNQLNLYRIDRGIDAGIDLSEKEGFPVIDANGYVFGRIYNSDALTSKVLPLTSEGFSVSCFLKENRGQAFIFKGDKDLKNQGLCKIEEIPAETILNVGDQIITSGLGGIFPYGLSLGEVVEILSVDSQGYQTAIVKPAINFGDTESVFVLTNKDIEEIPDNSETEVTEKTKENEKIEESEEIVQTSEQTSDETISVTDEQQGN